MNKEYNNQQVMKTRLFVSSVLLLFAASFIACSDDDNDYSGYTWHEGSTTECYVVTVEKVMNNYALAYIDEAPDLNKDDYPISEREMRFSTDELPGVDFTDSSLPKTIPLHIVRYRNPDWAEGIKTAELKPWECQVAPLTDTEAEKYIIDKVERVKGTISYDSSSKLYLMHVAKEDAGGEDITYILHGYDRINGYSAGNSVVRVSGNRFFNNETIRTMDRTRVYSLHVTSVEWYVE